MRLEDMMAVENILRQELGEKRIIRRRITKIKIQIKGLLIDDK